MHPNRRTFILILATTLMSASRVCLSESNELLAPGGLQFAGQTAVGVRHYPQRGVYAQGLLPFHIYGDVGLPAIDSDARTAYYFGTQVPRLFAIDLETLSIFDEVDLGYYDDHVVHTFIDAERKIVYAATVTGSTGGAVPRFIRIHLGDVITSEDLILEHSANAAFIDLERQMAFIFSQFQVSRVSLGTFEVLDHFSLHHSLRWVMHAAFDTASDTVLLVLGEPYRIARVDPQSFELLDEIMLSQNTNPTGLIVDSESGFAFFTQDNVIHRVRLDDFTIDGSVTAAGTDNLQGVLDAENHLIYYAGVYNSIYSILRLDIETLELGFLPLPDGTPEVSRIWHDPFRNHLLINSRSWAGGFYDPSIKAIDADSAEVVRSLSISQPEISRGCYSAAFDPIESVMYFGDTIGGLTLTDSQSARVIDSIYGFNPLHGQIWVSLIDEVDRMGYFGVQSNPGSIDRLNLETGESDGQIILDEGEGLILSGALSSTRREAYFGLNSAPGKLIRVDLETFSRNGMVTLQSGDDFVRSMAIDDAVGVAYLGLSTSPGRVVKVDLETFSQVNSLTLASNESYLRTAVMDPGKAVYFGSGGPNGRIVKIDASSFSRVGALSFGSSEFDFRSSIIDPTNRFALFGSFSEVSQVRGVDLDSFSLLSIPGPFYGHVDDLRCATYDYKNGVAFFASLTSSPDLKKFVINHKGSMLGTRVTLESDAWLSDTYFHSYSPEGNLLLSIYDDSDPRRLVWESNIVQNTGNNASVVVPISSGSPNKLRLPAGTYWLAWQTDSPSKVGAYRPGAGFRIEHPFSSPPQLLNTARAIENNEIWTQYFSYQPDPLVPMLLGKVAADTAADGNHDGILDMGDVSID